MHCCSLVVFVILLFSHEMCSQQFTKAIEDNSYFIEEAYNQEERVVQHISNGYYQSSTEDFVYTFTQEWPVGGLAHQFSFTVPYQSMNSGASGLGDMYLHYRYQMWDGANWCWLAPRVSVILPTEKSSNGLGNGVVGIQLNLPASKRWSNGFITHVNIGATLLPNVEGTITGGGIVRKTLPSFFGGASGIMLFTENFNFMCEVLWVSNAELDIYGNIARSSEILISPGFRYAITMGDLQIVPGIAVPFTFIAEQFDTNVFGYISFEHPF